jgi:hypothetical protein
MGIEYTAKFEQTVLPPTLDDVLRAICSNPCYKLVKLK